MTNRLLYYMQIGNLYCREIKHTPLPVYLDFILTLNPVITMKWN